MNVIKNILICSSLTLALVGCAPGAADWDKPVAGDYILNRTSAHEISVVPKDGWTDPSQIIPPKVVKIAWNDRYVIAERQVLKRRSPNDPNDTYEEPSDKFDFWILDTKAKKSYGPYDQQQFEKEKATCQIPESLKLQAVSS